MGWAEVGLIPRAEGAMEGLGAEQQGQSHGQHLQEGPRLVPAVGWAMEMARGSGTQRPPVLMAQWPGHQLGG